MNVGRMIGVGEAGIRSTVAVIVGEGVSVFRVGVIEGVSVDAHSCPHFTVEMETGTGKVSVQGGSGAGFGSLSEVGGRKIDRICRV